jgi:citrate lyase subunit beta/citryl-CoA lyase
MKPYSSTLLGPGHKESREDKVFTADEIVKIDAVAHSEEIAPASPRIVSLLGATGPCSDEGHELGFEFTPERFESLCLRSRIALFVRAAGLHCPIGSLSQDIHEGDSARKFTLDKKHLVYRGSIAIHSWQVTIANEIFAPTAEDKDRGRPNDRGIHGRGGPAHRHRPCEDRGRHRRLRHCYRGRGLGARP